MKWVHSILRLRFLSQCLKNDLIPRFLSFRVPQNGCFAPTIVHNFQRRLLKSEVHRAREAVQHHANEAAEALLPLKCVRDELAVSICFYVRQWARSSATSGKQRHAKKVSNLSEQQGKPLRTVGQTVKVLTDVKPPQFVIDVLAMGPKHPVRDEFNDMHFLASMDNCMRALANDGVEGDATNELNGLASWYVKMARKPGPDRTVKKVAAYLKRSSLKAVPFD